MKIRPSLVLLAALALTITSALAQRASIKETKGYQQLPDRGLSAGQLFKKASPSVVVITVLGSNLKPAATGSGVVIPPNRFINKKAMDSDNAAIDNINRKILSSSKPSTPLMAHGTIDEYTTVVTNCHVIAESAPMFFVTQGKFSGTGRVVGRDDPHDLCVVGVRIFDNQNVKYAVDGSGRRTRVASQLAAAQISPPQSLQIGDPVYAIGAPKGLELTLSSGIVSGFRKHVGSQVIQTTTPISPGSSGGGLFDSRGRLVGITTMYLDGGQNLNFAVPAQLIGSIPALQQSAVARSPLPTGKLHSRATADAAVAAAEAEAAAAAASAARFTPTPPQRDRWLLVDTNPNGSQTYVDTQTLQRNDSNVSMWMKTRWPSPQSSASEVFDEFLVNQIYRCASRQILTIYASRWLRGAMVSSMDMQNLTQTRVVTPGTVDEQIYTAICRQ